MFLRPISESIEMYLKSLAELKADEPVAIARLAERLSVTQVSANEMVKRLVEQEFVQHLPYKGVLLTPMGWQIAYSVIRRQKLWECFLYQHLHIAWPRLYELACDLEHATAPEVTEALAVFLGEPTTCPYGLPIPTAGGVCAPLVGVSLGEMKVGDRGRVQAILSTHLDVLTYLYQRHVLPGAEFTLLEIAPLQGPLTVRLNDKEVVLGWPMAEFVLVHLL